MVYIDKSVDNVSRVSTMTIYELSQHVKLDRFQFELIERHNFRQCVRRRLKRATGMIIILNERNMRIKSIRKQLAMNDLFRQNIVGGNVYCVFEEKK